MNYVADKAAQDPVAPFAGAGIEMLKTAQEWADDDCRSLHGSVD